MSAVGAIKTTEVHFGNGAVVRSGKTTLALTYVLRRNRVDAEEYQPSLKRVFLIPDDVRPIFKSVSIRHIKEVKMPSPRKAPPSQTAETDMPSRKKEVAAPSKSLGKTQGQKAAQVAQRTKGKPKG